MLGEREERKPSRGRFFDFDFDTRHCGFAWCCFSAGSWLSLIMMGGHGRLREKNEKGK